LGGAYQHLLKHVRALSLAKENAFFFNSRGVDILYEIVSVLTMPGAGAVAAIELYTTPERFKPIQETGPHESNN